MTTLESELVRYWSANADLVARVSGGFWRDEVPEKDTAGRPIKPPFGRFSLIAQTLQSLESAGPENTQTGQRCSELRTIQVDVWDTDTERLRQVAELVKPYLDRWQPDLVTPEVFIRADRTNWLFIPEDAEDMEWEGRTVWHFFTEYVVEVETEI